MTRHRRKHHKAIYKKINLCGVPYKLVIKHMPETSKYLGIFRHNKQQIEVATNKGKAEAQFILWHELSHFFLRYYDYEKYLVDNHDNNLKEAFCTALSRFIISVQKQGY